MILAGDAALAFLIEFSLCGTIKFRVQLRLGRLVGRG